MAESESRPAVAFHPAAASRLMSFGPFRFDRLDRTLTRDGAGVHLPPRVLAVLECLLDRPGRVVPKQALLDAGWQDAHVAESSLTEAIGQLRQALGDASQAPAYIQTVHRRGYRFIAPVEIAAGPSSAATPLSLVESPGAPVGPSAGSAIGAGADRAVLMAPATERTPSRPRRRLPGLAIGVTLGVASAALAWMVVAWGAAPAAVVRTNITLSADHAPAPGLTAHPVVALAPAGDRIVYVAGTPGRYQLFERALDQFDAVPIAGTEGAHGVFFSPDGAAIGYFADGWLHTMALATRQSLRLADAGASFGGTWLGDSIVVATGGPTGLLRVSLRDGAVTPVPVAGDRASRLRFPQPLDDGRTIVATEWRVTQRDSVVVAIDTVTGDVREIAPGVSPRWFAPGWLAWVRHDVLMVRPFPADGTPVAMASGVMTGVTGAAQYAVAASGSLVYLPAEPERRHRDVVRIDPSGVHALPFERREFQNIAVSPDGRHLAATIYAEGASDLWIGDVTRGTLSRVTSEGASVDPVWTPDGRAVLFGWLHDGAMRVRRFTPYGTGVPEDVTTTSDFSPTSVAPDGTILGQRLHPARAVDLALVPPGHAVARDWLATPASEARGRISPDGRWVVFDSDRSGRREVYLRPLHDPSRELLVSPSGGRDAHWANGGAAIVYAATGGIVEVRVVDGRLGPAARTTSLPDVMQVRPAGDGSFIGLRRVHEERPITTFRMVTGWRNEVRERLGR